jgi:hypothetical protein
MLRFNTLLQEAGLDPEKVFLLRHEDKRVRSGLYQAWRSAPRDFEAYQGGQKWQNRFPEGSVLASFVLDPGGATLFAGLYEVMRLWRSAESYDDPLLGRVPPEDRSRHDTQHSNRMLEYEGKLVIDWGPGTRQWRQLASKQNKGVLEIRREVAEPPFPRYINFMHRLGDLQNIYPSWQSRLDAKGVYLLAFDDGMQYVGSVTGRRGFWQRWSDYLLNGHGGNQVLIRDQRDARTATVSILETSSSADTDDEIIGREMLWQRKLGTRAKQLDNERA